MTLIGGFISIILYEINFAQNILEIFFPCQYNIFVDGLFEILSFTKLSTGRWGPVFMC